MIYKKLSLTLLIMLLCSSVACDIESTATPTLEPPPTVTVSQPTSPPNSTQTSAPPTSPAETATTSTATIDSATADAVTPTLAVTATSTVQPSPESQTFAITEPVAGADWPAGGTVTVSGSAPAATDVISATLRAAGLVLASAETTPSAAGDWQMTLDVPASVTGTALVHFLAGDEPAVEIPVQITLPAATSGPHITLDYPQTDSTVVSGHVLFFTGTVQRPPEETLTIAVLFEDCQTVASTTSFTVGEGGQWWGYIIVPEIVFGPACAIAYLGEFQQSAWRAAHTPIVILEQDDPQGQGVFIGNFAGSELTPGESVTVYGSAYNAPNRLVRVSLQVDGEAVAQGTTTADGFGYWEINLALPSQVSGAATGQFTASVSYADQEISETVPFEIGP